jgi:hypothetical protein
MHLCASLLRLSGCMSPGHMSIDFLQPYANEPLFPPLSARKQPPSTAPEDEETGDEEVTDDEDEEEVDELDEEDEDDETDDLEDEEEEEAEADPERTVE